MARTETLTKLRKFATPTICNIIKLFDIRLSNAGFMDACIVSFFSRDAADGRLYRDGNLLFIGTTPSR